MTDVEILEELQSEIGAALRKVPIIILGINPFSYSVNKEKQVTGINLSKARLRFFPPSIVNFSKLQILQISQNWFYSIPVEIKNFSDLKRLYLGGNNLRKIPKEIGDLQNLIKLSLSGNDLDSLPDSLILLKKMEDLSLRNNKFTSFPSVLCKLPSLRRLDLRKNFISHIPVEITGLKKLQNFEIDIEDIKNIPLEILSNGIKAIQTYLFSASIEDVYPIGELKVLVVGNAGVGKTSLIHRLIFEKWHPKFDVTEGVDISELCFKIKGQEYRVNFWDFGGQEIMHSTHRFFLTERSLYILVLDGRKEENPDYWLHHIKSFGGDSPIFILLNKSDLNPYYDLDRHQIRDKYSNVKLIKRVSCLTSDGLKKIRSSLEGELVKINHIQTVWPKKWFKVRQQLEQINKSFICWSDYNRICRNEDIVDRADREVLLKFLNDLGVIVYLKRKPLLNTYVLDPNWITTAVYKIINSKELAFNHGRMNISDLCTMYVDDIDFKYTPEEISYIIEFLIQFELCFEVNDEVFFPELFVRKKPDFHFPLNDLLKMQIEYEFLPKSVFPKLLVRLYKDIADFDCIWKFGAHLKSISLNTEALIKIDPYLKCLIIVISGDNKREYLNFIRKVIQDINSDFHSIKWKEVVSLPDDSGLSIDYEELLGLENMNEAYVAIGKIRKKFRIKYLLDGVDMASDRQNVKKKDKNKQMTKIKIVIGNGVTIHGDVIVANKIANSFNKADTCPDVSDSIKETLKDLSVSVGKLTEYVSDIDARILANDVQNIVNESIMSIPEKEKLLPSEKSLRKIANKAGEIGKFVIQNLDKLILLMGLFP